MAGKLAWALSIDGIPAALNGLRELDRTIMSITAHMSQLSNIMGRLGGSGGLGGMPGVPVYRGGPGGAGGGILGLAGLAGLAGKRGGDTTSVTYNNYGAPKEYNVLQDYGNFMLGRRRANTAKLAAGMRRRGTFGDPLTEAREVAQRSFDRKMLEEISAQAAWPFIDAQWVKSVQASGFPLAAMPWQRPGQKGWPFTSSNGGGGGQEGGSQFSNPWGRMMRQAYGYRPGASGVPPQMPPPIIPGGGSAVQLEMSMGSPGFLFGRQGFGGFMRGQFGGIGGIFRGGGGGEGGYLGGLAGRMGEGGPENFIKMLGIGAVAMMALHKAAELLKVAFEHMAEVYREGARLYQSSARVGVDAGTLYSARRALGAAGIDPETADRLALMGQFSQQGQRVSIAGLTLAARRVGDQGTLQQIQNMRGVIGETANSPFTRLAARRAEEAVPDFQRIHELSYSIRMEWKSFEEGIAERLSPAVKELLFTFDMLLKALNGLASITDRLKISGFTAIGGMLGNIFGQGALGSMLGAALSPESAPPAKFRRAFAGGITSGGSITPWERMGFQFTGAAGSRDYAKEIAHNTKVVADHLTGKTGMSQTTVPFTSYVPNGMP